MIVKFSVKTFHIKRRETGFCKCNSFGPRAKVLTPKNTFVIAGIIEVHTVPFSNSTGGKYTLKATHFAEFWKFLRISPTFFMQRKALKIAVLKSCSSLFHSLQILQDYKNCSRLQKYSLNGNCSWKLKKIYCCLLWPLKKYVCDILWVWIVFSRGWDPCLFGLVLFPWFHLLDNKSDNSNSFSRYIIFPYFVVKNLQKWNRS